MVGIRVDGQEVSVETLLRRMRARGMDQVLDELITEQLVEREAEEMGLQMFQMEVQVAANHFREKHRLLKSEDMRAWLAKRQITASDWQAMLEHDVLVQQLKLAKFANDVDRYFAENRLSLDRAIIGRIVVDSEGLASELVLQLREEGAVFEEMARRFSVQESTRLQGGYVGPVSRKDLGATVAPSIFGGKPGSIVGPTKSGKHFHILRLIELRPALLDEAMRQQILDMLFGEWLAAAKAKASIEIPQLQRVVAAI